MKKIAILFLLSYGVSGGVAHATTYYVSKAGSDSQSCTQARTLSTPKLTINAGVGCLSAGDTLLVRAGTYAESITSAPSGTSWSASIRIAAYSGETVWMAPSADYVVSFSGAERYIEFDRINMDGRQTTYGPVALTGSANHQRFQNAEIIGSPRSGGCANICGGTDSEFINLVIHGGGKGGGCGWACGNAGWYSGGSNNLIDGCEIYDVSVEGIQVYNGSGVPANNNIIRNNRIHDIVRGGDPDPGSRIVGILIASGSNNYVYNNLIYKIGRSDGSGANAGIGVFGGSTTGTRIWNNTVVDNYFNGISIDTGVNNTAVQNNIFYGNSGAAFLDSGNGTTRDHNLEGVNPLFVDSAAGDFRLRAGSPAISAGAYLSTVATDFVGVPRPQGSASDIGAYQYRAATSTSTPATPIGLRVVSN